MNRIFVIIASILVSSSAYCQVTQSSSSVNYKKKDLRKMKWIEGKWRGMFENKPFYEIYQLENDTTLKITSYEWSGNDTSKTSVDYLYWKRDGYYLGKQQNWKATTITKNEIKMIPVNKASNEILWRRKDKKNWIAILIYKNGTRTYNMEYFDPFKTNL